jgi:hypothetical protein
MWGGMVVLEPASNSQTILASALPPAKIKVEK